MCLDVDRGTMHEIVRLFRPIVVAMFAAFVVSVIVLWVWAATAAAR